MPNTGKKIYFASDVHLGAPYIKDPLVHEKRFVRWLDSIKNDAEEIYLLGDIFDFWWEYKRVVPRGFTRTLGKIAELTDAGIPVHFFIGNHDIWIWDYLPTETGVILHKEPYEVSLQGQSFYMTHGDGLGDPNKLFKFVRSAFHSTFMQRLFATLVHPNWAMWIGYKWSGNSRLKESDKNNDYMGEDKEHLVLHTKNIMQKHKANFYVYGHRHIVLDLMINRDSRVIILGDWISNFSYGVLQQGQFSMEYFEEKTASQ